MVAFLRSTVIEKAPFTIFFFLIKNTKDAMLYSWVLMSAEFSSAQILNSPSRKITVSFIVKFVPGSWCRLNFKRNQIFGWKYHSVACGITYKFLSNVEGVTAGSPCYFQILRVTMSLIFYSLKYLLSIYVQALRQNTEPTISDWMGQSVQALIAHALIFLFQYIFLEHLLYVRAGTC